MLGRHCVKTWSSTQKCITLSSGEAELVAMVKMSTEVLGLIQLAKDWGHIKIGRVLADSSAALAIVRRKGNGKLRHVRVGMMWIQQTEDNGDLKYNKVSGDKNQGDLMTKGLGQLVREKHMAAIGQVARPGRAQTALQATTNNNYNTTHNNHNTTHNNPNITSPTERGEEEEEEEEQNEEQFICSVRHVHTHNQTPTDPGHSIVTGQTKTPNPDRRQLRPARASSSSSSLAATAATRGGVAECTCVRSHYW